MDHLASLTRLTAGRGRGNSSQVTRAVIRAVEHETKILPPEIVGPGGRVQIYDDVTKLFQLTFVSGAPAIQCGRYLGYIPINDQHALEISPRVPIGNLERLVGMAGGYTPRVLRKYTRSFAHSAERPSSIFDVIADQLLASFERVWEGGLLATYERETHVGSSPAGKINPFRSASTTRKAGRPLAVFSAFYRTTDWGPNRLIRLAFLLALANYSDLPANLVHRPRLHRVRSALDKLSGVKRPSTPEAAPSAIAGYVRFLPLHREHYADALLLSQLVVSDQGISIRGAGGAAVLPTVLIDMEKVFEEYSRLLLLRGLRGRAEVKDGNKFGDSGAKTFILEDIGAGLTNEVATPDIVIVAGGRPRLIIDAKYKPKRGLPERRDLNQVITYGTRYGCSSVMLLYAERQDDHGHCERLGRVGGISVYTGHVDLNAANIESEEANFVAAIARLADVD
jgi:5-methylcytosine-specific restriction endonuclease McrBC regulatory subunit McrC